MRVADAPLIAPYALIASVARMSEAISGAELPACRYAQCGLRTSPLDRAARLPSTLGTIVPGTIGKVEGEHR
jgi:hypothetical protein